ncbi:phage tail tape measure protein [Methylocystis sp. L43]|nr:phage tail tape measure protein [Methylocystis sp. L43]MBG0805028.1 phage tail tape measure protein [Methylocystis sp. H15]
MSKGPSIEATVSVVDKATATLQRMAGDIDKLARKYERLGGGSHLTGGMAPHFEAATRATNTWGRSLSASLATMKQLAGLAAGLAAVKLPHIAADAVRHYLPLDRELSTMRAVGGFDEASMSRMAQQQRDLARVYGQSPEHIAHAQNELVKRHFSAATTQAFIEKSAVLAQALGADVGRATTALEGVIFGYGEHVKNAADAARLGQRYSDISSIMAKRGAMSIEDIEGYWKYAAAGARSAGLSPEQAAAIGMVQKRENFAGEEAGVFTRQLAARIMMPTREGRMALAASGIDLSKFVDPTRRDASALNIALGENIGRGLGPSATKALQSALDSGKIADARGFAQSVIRYFEGDHGHQRAKDTNALAKQATDFWKVSQGKVDGSALWDAIVTKMSPQEAMAFLGVKQGSKAASILSQLSQLREYESGLSSGSGITQKIAREQQTSLASAFDRLKATVEDTSNSFVKANEGALKFGAGAAQTVAKWFGDADEGTKRAWTAAGGGATLAGGAFGVKSLLDLLKGNFGLTAAATQLEGAAAALTRAAGVMSGSKLPGEATGAVAAVGAAKKSPWGALGEMALIYSGMQLYKEKTAEWFGWTDAKRKQWDSNINARAWDEIKRYMPSGRNTSDLSNNLPAYDADRLSVARSAREGALSRFSGLESLRSAARDGAREGSLSALFTGKDNALAHSFAAGGAASQPQQVDVEGNVRGAVDIHQSLRIDPSPLFMAKMSEAQHAVAQVQGSIMKLGRTMTGGGNAPARSGGSVLAPAPAPLKL